IKQRFEPQVYDNFVVRGNTAVLQCQLPSFVREYVTVDSWIRDDKQVLKRNDMRGSSYTVLNSGELLIHGVLEKDSLRTFLCQTRHKLTGEMVMSVSAGKIVVTAYLTRSTVTSDQFFDIRASRRNSSWQAESIEEEKERDSQEKKREEAGEGEDSVSFEELRNILLKIPGYSEFSAEDTAEWMVCESSDSDFKF
ncbi:Down syndrome cell adhesion molecule-like protein 1 homolog, partial [Stegodyphus dumicola]|uniref:Down syndrome cell adhesion molecule-like protein 1 homolog n=1 Tax=Stegodyphus dumicola TaxID=202533 RepID=UPI0015AB640B